MSDFFDMGGYAAFVWPSFIATTVVMLAVWYVSRRKLAAAEAELKTLEALGEGPGKAGTEPNS